jgi:UPF0755 protein
VIVAILVVLALAAAAAFVLLRGGSDEAADYPGPGTGSVTVVVVEGDTASAIGASLADADVVRSAGAFVAAATADERSLGIVPGTYRMRLQMSAAGALELMLDPATRIDVVTIPEGTRLDDTLDLIAANTRLKLPALQRAAANVGDLGLPAYAGNPATAEGFLFPAQYDVAPDADAAAFLRSMVQRYVTTTEGIDLVARAEAAGKDPYDVLIVASLVQAEVGPDDYAKAVRVIENRLEMGMRLQIDATVNYALDRSTIDVTIADTETASPYNTYANSGLPPTPINSPGEAAIEAALEPADGDWLYWVTTDIDTGLTKFSTNYEDFLEDKAEFDASRR